VKVSGFSRVSKDLIIKELEKEFKDKPCFFVAQHGFLPATALDTLRARLRKTNTRYFVAKKSLGKIAMERANIQAIPGKLEGSCGFAFAGGDPVAPSKVLVEFAKENENFKIQNGFMNGQVMLVDQIKVLASLPSREILLAKVAGGMIAPISNFVGVLSGTLRKMVTVLDAIAKKKGSG